MAIITGSRVEPSLADEVDRQLRSTTRRRQPQPRDETWRINDNKSERGRFRRPAAHQAEACYRRGSTTGAYSTEILPTRRYVLGEGGGVTGSASLSCLTLLVPCRAPCGAPAGRGARLRVISGQLRSPPWDDTAMRFGIVGTVF